MTKKEKFIVYGAWLLGWLAIAYAVGPSANSLPYYAGLVLLTVAFVVGTKDDETDEDEVDEVDMK